MDNQTAIINRKMMFVVTQIWDKLLQGGYSDSDICIYCYDTLLAYGHYVRNSLRVLEVQSEQLALQPPSGYGEVAQLPQSIFVRLVFGWNSQDYIEPAIADCMILLEAAGAPSQSG